MYETLEVIDEDGSVISLSEEVNDIKNPTGWSLVKVVPPLF